MPSWPPPSSLTSEVMLLDQDQTITGVKTFSAAPVFNAGPITFPVLNGTGDNLVYYWPSTGWLEDIRQGTTAAPITTGSGPVVKISRTESILASTMPGGLGNNNQGNA